MFNERDIPHSIIIDGVPSRRKHTGLIDFWARIRPQQQSLEGLMEMARMETDLEPFFITRFDLGRRVPEKDVSALALFFDWLQSF